MTEGSLPKEPDRTLLLTIARKLETGYASETGRAARKWAAVTPEERKVWLTLAKRVWRVMATAAPPKPEPIVMPTKKRVVRGRRTGK